MASCEKCWADSGGLPEVYSRLIKERTGICTPEDQAGVGAQMCPECGRNTIHIYCHCCMACGYKPKEGDK